MSSIEQLIMAQLVLRPESEDIKQRLTEYRVCKNCKYYQHQCFTRCMRSTLFPHPTSQNSTCDNFRSE